MMMVMVVVVVAERSDGGDPQRNGRRSRERRQQYVARSLGITEFGIFSLAWVTYGVVLNVSRGLATDPLVVRFSGGDRAAWRRAVASVRTAGDVVGGQDVAVDLAQCSKRRRELLAHPPQAPADRRPGRHRASVRWELAPTAPRRPA